MDLEERTRLAPKRLPARGLLSALLGRWIIVSSLAMLVAVVSALFWVIEHGHRLGLGELLTAIAAAAGLLLLLIRQLSASRDLLRGSDLLFAGDFEGASRIFFDVLDRTSHAPMVRALAAESLAMTAVLGGHADRAIVLLRAIATSGAMQAGLSVRLEACTANALLGLGRAAEARAVLARCKDLEADVTASGIALLVAALAGTPNEVRQAIERFGEKRRSRARMQIIKAAQIPYGFLVVAYGWDRVARALSPNERAEAERLRAEALNRAKGVPRHFHAYLAPHFPDFDRFARAAAA